MKDYNEEIGTGEEGVGSQRARIGGDRGAASDTRDDAAQAPQGEIADAELRARKRTDGGGSRGRRASKSRNAMGRTGPRNTGRRTSAAEAGSRKGLVATRNRMKKRSGGPAGTRATTRRPARPGTRTGNSGSNRTTAKSARGTAASRGRAGTGAKGRAGLRTRSKARRKAGKKTAR